MVMVMRQKNVLITGANSGIGKAAAINLAREGAHVIMVCRDAKKGNLAMEEVKLEAATELVDLLICDLSSIEAIKNLSKSVHERYEKLHVLINNAGVIVPERVITTDGFELQWAVNYLAPLILTSLLKDLLKNSGEGRVVTVSSGAHKIGRLNLDDLQLEKGYSAFKAYGQSKLAVTMLTMLQAKAYKPLGITVNALHPGAVATNISVDRNTGARTKLMKLFSVFFLSPDDGAATAIYLAKNQSVKEMTGTYFYKKKPSRTSKYVKDTELQQKLLAKTLSQLVPFGIGEL
jgi:NAD(P)-dependent dehydrogenase (short-subunit alcohol dehydrogenase family)